MKIFISYKGRKKKKDDDAIKLVCCTKNDKEAVLNFVKNEDNSFPIKLSSRVKLEDFVDKILEIGKVYAFKIEKKIIGLIAFYANDYISRKAYLTYICVNQAYRDNKLGLQLMNQMYKECKKSEMKSIFLSTNVKNIHAQKFYEKLGYVRCEKDDDNYKYEMKI